ncbi:hypothetical protein Pan216_13320 [Planctomycetes bacterium Pan216]|uniref:Uncharacterized protein n=1 Tax=Kolteria novifilia TaxID=2527975 RepID=A0A518B0J7_9BACT|nr:hypothetical protein Pan216_13320 [Planctomycetes bacterium Pan216]
MVGQDPPYLAPDSNNAATMSAHRRQPQRRDPDFRQRRDPDFRQRRDPDSDNAVIPIPTTP